MLVKESNRTLLTLSWRRPLSYRNQFIDLPRKLMDWFLYYNGLRHERVKRRPFRLFLETITISDSNGIRTHNHLVHKPTLNHLARLASLVKLAKWLSVRLGTKWLWVQISLLSLKVQIWHLLRARSSLTFMQIVECRFTVKLLCDMIITYSYNNMTIIYYSYYFEYITYAIFEGLLSTASWFRDHRQISCLILTLPVLCI